MIILVDGVLDIVASPQSSIAHAHEIFASSLISTIPVSKGWGFFFFFFFFVCVWGGGGTGLPARHPLPYLPKCCVGRERHGLWVYQYIWPIRFPVPLSCCSLVAFKPFKLLIS